MTGRGVAAPLVRSNFAGTYPQTAEVNDAMRIINDGFGSRPVETVHVVELSLRYAIVR